jgi:hypothetical protein
MGLWGKRFLIRGIIFFFFILVFSFSVGEAKEKTNFPQFGRTYEIVEPDAYEEILNAVKRVDVEKFKKTLQKRIKELAVVNEFNIPYAKETRTRYFEPRYELPFDIVDANGRVIYPKGFTFNPLQYMTLQGIFVFFDAGSPLHLNWLKKEGYTKRLDVMFIAVKGDVLEASRVLKAPVYRASKILLERFDVKRIPSIIKQNGGYLEITEVGMKDVERLAYSSR